MNKLTNAESTFTFNGVTYTKTKTGYCYKTTGTFDKKGQEMSMRIAKHIFEQKFDEFMAQMDEADDWDAEQEIANRKDLQDAKDRETENNFNGKKTGYTRKEVNDAVEKAIEKEMKKVAKSRRSKDVAFEMDTDDGHITLTAKQVDFIKHLPDTNFWEHGLDSMPWCDVLADEIGGQFAGKPMTVGAMISTLREKGLVTVGRDTERKGKPKYMALTVTGKQIATELGLD